MRSHSIFFERLQALDSFIWSYILDTLSCEKTVRRQEKMQSRDDDKDTSSASSAKGSCTRGESIGKLICMPWSTKKRTETASDTRTELGLCSASAAFDAVREASLSAVIA